MTYSKYKNIRKSQLVIYLEQLAQIHPDLKIKKATKHSLKLHRPNARRSYPVPINHPKMADWVVEGVKDWLTRSAICSEIEFDKGLGLKR